MKNDLTSSDSDGGYYAIKGFIFQFDKSLAEVLAHPESQIEIEQTQDVSVDLYFTQVKYKETQTYAPSKIKKPVKQLLNELKDNPRGKYILYCYFKDKVAQSNKLTLAELNIILGKDSSKYAGSLKRSFIANFTLEFSENYDSQFIRLLSVIKDSFNLKTDDEALVYHAIFRTKLLEIATRPHRSSRTIQFSTLEALLKESQKTIFERAYSEYLSQKAYLSFLKKEYFTFKKIYVPREERLFVIEVDAQINDSDLIQIVNILQQRYYHKDRSPAPFICFIGLKSTRLKNLKRALWDRSLF
ncbi:MAG TPA: hypothetical protein VD794_12675, partial [Flavisolibacter sp.]|nr:hypothetical protein [Flavisolibacter sp.]